MKSSVNPFWRPPPTVRAAITRGDRLLREYQQRVVADAEKRHRERHLNGADRGQLSRDLTVKSREGDRDASLEVAA